jgi:hypothetical protein
MLETKKKKSVSLRVRENKQLIAASALSNEQAVIVLFVLRLIQI